MKLTDKDIANLILHITQTHKMVKENNQKIRDMEMMLLKFADNVKIENRNPSQCLD